MPTNTSYDIITVGGSVRDYLAISGQDKVIIDADDPARKKLLAFEYGAKIVVSQLVSCLGGGACNVAVGASRLGLRSAVLANLSADDDGAWAKKSLSREKVDTNLLQFDKTKPIGFSFVVIAENKGDHVLFSYRGANDNLKIKLAPRVRTKWLYLASLSGQDWPSQIQAINRLCCRNKIKLAFNPGASQIDGGLGKLKEILKTSTILLVNKSEAIKLAYSGQKRLLKKDEIQIQKIIRILWQLGPKVVVITEGKTGAHAYDGKNLISLPARKSLKAIDTTGAGDGFSSAFISSLIRQKTLKIALQNGIKNGESVIKYLGAQKGLLRKKDLF